MCIPSTSHPIQVSIFFSSFCSVGLTCACVSVWPLLYDFALPCLYVCFCVSFALCKWIIRTHGAPNRKFFIYLLLRCSCPRCLSSVIHVLVVVFFYWLNISFFKLLDLQSFRSSNDLGDFEEDTFPSRSTPPKNTRALASTSKNRGNFLFFFVVLRSIFLI